MKNFTLIYQQPPVTHVWRTDIEALTQDDAIQRLRRQIGGSLDIKHVIEHEPVDASKPTLRVLGMHLPLEEGHPDTKVRPRNGTVLLQIRLGPVDTHLDNIQERIREALVDFGIPDTSDLIDPVMAKLREEAFSNSFLFDMEAWPYDGDRYHLITMKQSRFCTVADWYTNRHTLHDDLDDAVQLMDVEPATLYLELWPGRRC